MLTAFKKMSLQNFIGRNGRKGVDRCGEETSLPRQPKSADVLGGAQRTMNSSMSGPCPYDHRQLSERIHHPSMLALPIELWDEVLLYIDDYAQLASVALVCRSFSKIATWILSRRRRQCVNAGSVTSFYEAVTSSHCAASMIWHLDIRLQHVHDRDIARSLPPALRTLQNLRSLELVITDHSLMQACVQDGLLDAHLPELKIFHTSFPVDPALLSFIGSNKTISYLSVVGPEPEPCDDKKHVLPSLQTLKCDASFLSHLMPSIALTSLYLVSCNTSQLESVVRLLGPQLLRLHFGVPGLSSQGTDDELWTTQDFLTGFPHMEYLQFSLMAPQAGNAAADLRVRGRPPIRMNGRKPLTVAWMFPGDRQSRSLFRMQVDTDALLVLRHWAPYVGQILYGDGRRPMIAVSLNPDRTKVVHSELVKGTVGTIFQDLFPRSPEL
ncbi:hypothetical protein C8Q78DRAFT_366324 [Trametes maxima]|nr:hypothetical protein C8Q78DRAFT_366324 [Trametes maxima]